MGCGKMWKTLEVQKKPIGEAIHGARAVCATSGLVSAAMQACSACEGDYEDPDRTAWSADEVADEPGDEALGEFDEGQPGDREDEGGAPRTSAEEFPGR
jgi:hypothetical protein